MMVKLQNSRPVLDDLDLMLIRELKQDARVSCAAIASKLGASRPTISRRLDRLIDQGVITITAMTAHAALGYGTALMLAINAPHGMVDTLAGQLVSVKNIKHLWFTTGRYDILAAAFYRSHDEYLDSLAEDIGSFPGNVRVETLLSIKLIKSSWPVDNITAVDPHSYFIPTELDLSVIRGLEESPRVPLKELARDIGASFSSVRTSYRKLTSQGITNVISMHGPAAYGHMIIATTLMQVHPSSLKTVTNKLAAYPFVHHVHITYGAFNCIMWTSFENSDQMSEFLTHELSTIPGVVHYESLVVLKTLKRSFTLISENSSGMNGSQKDILPDTSGGVSS